MLWLIGSLILGSFVLLWMGQSVAAQQLKALRAGEYGEFTVSDVFDFSDTYIAVDQSRKKIFFINASIPKYDNRALITGHSRGQRFQCKFEDVEKITVSVANDIATLYFYFKSEIPKSNKWKQLHFVSNAGASIEKLKKHLCDVPFLTQ
jgi:hypothetical protein